MTPGGIRVVELDVALTRAADHDAALPHLVTAAVEGQRHELLLHTELLRRDSLRRRRRLRLVDHRGARFDVSGRPAGPAAGLRLHQSRGDPELADVEVAVCLQQDAWRREECVVLAARVDRKSTRLNSSHVKISYAVFCLK